MAAVVVLRRVWPPASPDCTATQDARHWPFPHPHGGTACAACGQFIATPEGQPS